MPRDLPGRHAEHTMHAQGRSHSLSAAIAARLSYPETVLTTATCPPQVEDTRGSGNFPSEVEALVPDRIRESSAAAFALHGRLPPNDSAGCVRKTGCSWHVCAVFVSYSPNLEYFPDAAPPKSMSHDLRATAAALGPPGPPRCLEILMEILWAWSSDGL